LPLLHASSTQTTGLFLSLFSCGFSYYRGVADATLCLLQSPICLHMYQVHLCFIWRNYLEGLVFSCIWIVMIPNNPVLLDFMFLLFYLFSKMFFLGWPPNRFGLCSLRSPKLSHHPSILPFGRLITPRALHPCASAFSLCPPFPRNRIQWGVISGEFPHLDYIHLGNHYRNKIKTETQNTEILFLPPRKILP
jgi:hypothetical protein